MNVGVFGGAFDPPHVGHLELARRGIGQFGLDRLLVRVVEDPGHKEVGTAPENRLRLTELAFAPLDEAEVALDPHPRTVDSLLALGLDDPLFLIGADEFASFPTWTSPDRVLRLARLGVATRPGVDRARLEAVRAGLERTDRVAFFEIEPLPVSSSDIRARLAAGLSVEGLVPPAVAAEISRLGLYAHVDRSGGGGMLRGDRTEGTTQT
jgi:nicotinate-nucleotide adenylyltransferase